MATEAPTAPTKADQAVEAETKRSAANGDFVIPLIGDIDEDVFEEIGAATELLQEWHKAEDRLFAAASMPRRMGAQLRTQALQTLTQFFNAARLPRTAWFSGVSLLDRSGAEDERDLPAVCLAIVHTLSKFEHAEKHAMCPLWLEKFVMFTVSGTVPLKDVKAWERKFISNQHSHLLVPNAEMWATAFVQRLDVLSRKAFSTTLAWTHDHILSCIYDIELGSPDHGLSPRLLAIGLTGLGLVSAGVLPQESVLEGGGPACTPCEFPPEIWERILALLLNAMCCSYVDLCGASKLIAELSQPCSRPPFGRMLLI